MDREKFLELLKMDPYSIEAEDAVEDEQFDGIYPIFNIVRIKLDKRYNDAWMVTDLDEDPPTISCFVDPHKDLDDNDPERDTEDDSEDWVEFEESVSNNDTKQWFEFLHCIRNDWRCHCLYG